MDKRRIRAVVHACQRVVERGGVCPESAASAYLLDSERIRKNEAMELCPGIEDSTIWQVYDCKMEQLRFPVTRPFNHQPLIVTYLTVDMVFDTMILETGKVQN
ncbi:hypothetical protein P67b_00024 [Ruegeria phage Tedan]|nr:hypothetical protein P67b_00024 [Ruegeria phage Tedan]